MRTKSVLTRWGACTPLIYSYTDITSVIIHFQAAHQAGEEEVSLNTMGRVYTIDLQLYWHHISYYTFLGSTDEDKVSLNTMGRVYTIDLQLYGHNISYYTFLGSTPGRWGGGQPYHDGARVHHWFTAIRTSHQLLYISRQHTRQVKRRSALPWWGACTPLIYSYTDITSVIIHF